MNRLVDYQPTQSELANSLGKQLSKGAGDDLFFRSIQIVRRAITDKELPHGAVRVFNFLVEFSWLRSYGSERPFVITISQARIAREIGANKEYVRRWLKLLGVRGYFTCEKLEFLYRKKNGRKGRAFKCRYSILLDLVGGSSNAPATGSSNAPATGSSNAPAGRASSGPIQGGREVREGGGQAPPPNENSFLKKLNRMYPREIKEQIDELTKLRKEFEADTKNWCRELRKDAKDFIDFALQEIAKHPDRREHYEKKIHEIKADPDSWQKKSLTLSGAAVVANFTRKIKLARLALAGVSESELEPPKEP